MRGTGSVKRVFPGGNTSQGFYSFYDYIITPDATRIFILKGGPGVGKSTLIRRIGEAMVQRGYDIEFHHCSSDNKSLDGVVIPDIGVALIDGTAPHIVDPKNPGCVGEIVHLGDFWDEEGIRAHKKEILDLNSEVSSLFQRAYRFLKAAKSVYDDWEACNQEAMLFGRANRKAALIIDELLGSRPVALQVGRDRHLFASAITPDGLVNYLETIVGPCSKRYVIDGRPGTGKSTLLRKVAAAAMERGFDVEMYHCPLNPERVEHVVIPRLGVALTKSIEPHVYQGKPGDERHDMDECLNQRVLEKYQGIVQENAEVFEDLFQRAIRFIGAAKVMHDLMETYYVPHMDFNGIHNLGENILKRVLKYAGEHSVKIG